MKPPEHPNGTFYQGDAVPSFPPVFDGPDLVDRLAEVHRQWRRDNGIWCRQELERILAEYPWSVEASDLYGMIVSKTQHVYSPTATIRLAEWIAQMGFAERQCKPNLIGKDTERFRVMYELIETWVGEQNQDPPVPWATVLDIGAQQGEMTYQFLNIPGVLHGHVTDASSFNLRTGAYFNGTKPDGTQDERLTWTQCLAEDLPFPDNSMDVVLLSGVLEHVLDPDRCVDEAERVLRPGGLLIIQVPFGGMEGTDPNPHANTLSFRSHVHSVDPLPYLSRGVEKLRYYIEYTWTQLSRHTWVGALGDWVVAYEVVKKP